MSIRNYLIVKVTFRKVARLPSGGIAHGILSGSVAGEPIGIVPSGGGPVVGVPWKDAFPRIVPLPPGGRRKRWGEAVSARPAPPVCGTATRSSSRRLDRLRIVSVWTQRQLGRAAGPKAGGGGSAASSAAAGAPAAASPAPRGRPEPAPDGRG